MSFDHEDFKKRLGAARASSDQFSAMLRDSEMLTSDISELAQQAAKLGMLMRYHGAERMNALGYIVGLVVAALDSAYGVVESDDE